MKKLFIPLLLSLLLLLAIAAQAEDTAVLVDNDDLFIRLRGYEMDDQRGFTVKLYVENRSDRTIRLQIRDMVADGYLLDGPIHNETLAAGSRLNMKFNHLYGLPGTPVKFDFRLYAFDNSTWDDVLDEHVTVFPQGEVSFVPSPREPLPSDALLMDNGNVTLAVIGTSRNANGLTATLYLHNKTDGPVLFYLTDSVINGFSANAHKDVTVPAGVYCITDVQWYSSWFEDNDVGEVTDVRLCFAAYDASVSARVVLGEGSGTVYPPNP